VLGYRDESGIESYVGAGDVLLPPSIHRFYTTGDSARFRAALLHLLGMASAVSGAAWVSDGRLKACSNDPLGPVS